MTSKEALKLLYSDAENYAYLNETEEDLKRNKIRIWINQTKPRKIGKIRKRI